MALNRLMLEYMLVDGASAGLSRITDSLRQAGGAGKEAADHMDAAVRQLGQGIKAAGIARELNERLVQPGKRAAADLQAAMQGLEVQLERDTPQKIAAQLEAASREAARIANPTAFSAEQIVGVETDLKQAGLQIDDILGKGGAAESVAQLATADQNLSLEQAEAAMLTFAGVFGIAGSEFGKAADLLVKAGSASAAGAGSLAEALKMAPSAGGFEQTEVLAALGVVSPVMQGSIAGTSMNAFLAAGAANDKKMGLGLFNEDGSRKSLVDQVDALNAKFGDLDARSRSVKLEKAFGREGARFADVLMQGDLRGMLQGIGRQRSLGERVDILSSGLNAREEALGGSTRTLMATLFEPLLEPFTKLTNAANDAVGGLNSLAEENDRVAKAVSFGALGAMGLAGGAAAFKFGQGGLSALRASSALSRAGGIGALMSALGGNAAGKLNEKVTGTKPVFVTNWPAGLSVPGGGGVPGVGGKAGGALAAVGAASVAGSAGFALGTAVQEGLIKDTKAADVVQGAIATWMLATPIARGLASDETLEGARMAQRQALQSLGVEVVVNQRSNGSWDATVQTDDGSVASAMARSGATQ